ncbi:hypothetical protein M427DRAFT_131541 [Gonapodya prolifera JEL478]|uniref:CUE domain-containing protein n=1 Tax=Gonapodya prolifera (strain JEL478) TaxID=1344416 RepID=A0A139AU99_GONPJ|nr:hypothetical protein M427DRAFT_131541 [Gonapodya prolifera JEL478]|eukprot:KXS20143.1 hypothetical protein M427DRAFT_131541 [Gonapodya prolifera JEL478]
MAALAEETRSLSLSSTGTAHAPSSAPNPDPIPFPPTINELASLLLSSSLLPAFSLLDFLRLYRPGNTQLLCHLMSSLAQSPAYLRDLRYTTSAAADQLASFVQLCDRVSRIAEQQNRALFQQSNGPHLPPPPDPSFLTALTSTTDLLRTLEPLLWCCPVDASAALLKSRPDLVGAILDAYDAITALWLPLQLANVNSRGSPRTDLRSLKLAALATVRAAIESNFLRPMGAGWDASFPPSTTSAPALSSAFSVFLHPLIDRAPLDTGSATFLETAPLLVDLDVEWDLRERTVTVRDQLMAGEDAGMDYVIMSLDHMLTFSGNSAVKAVRQQNKRDLGAMRAGYNGGGAQGALVIPAGKGATAETDYDETYITRTSLISQVRDLFPHLGEGFVEAGLAQFEDNAELLIMKILEDDLPAPLAKLDRSLARAPPPPQRAAPPLPARPTSNASNALVPYTGPELEMSDTPPEYTTQWPEVNGQAEEDLLAKRRNVFDGDQFDVFSGARPDRDAVILGKKKTESETALLRDRTALTDAARAVILEQQFEFDEYDDEYDDTYDGLQGNVEEAVAEDDEIVEGAAGKAKRVPAPIEPPVPSPMAAAEPELVHAMQTDPGVFETRARKTASRDTLRRVTGMTDEQVEGWHRMLMRDPNKDKVLAKYEWRGNRPPQNGGDGGESDEDEGGEDNGAPNGAGGRGGFRGGGRGGRGGRGGGSGPPGEGGDRKWKDKNKAQVGNHNRKSGHDRKMGRGAMGWQ